MSNFKTNQNESPKTATFEQKYPKPPRRVRNVPKRSQKLYFFEYNLTKNMPLLPHFSACFEGGINSPFTIFFFFPRKIIPKGSKNQKIAEFFRIFS